MFPETIYQNKTCYFNLMHKKGGGGGHKNYKHTKKKIQK